MIQREAGTKLDPDVVEKFMTVAERVGPAILRDAADCYGAPEQEWA
jgi:response regulator RpfG family c-di-GMP phosphodiesterase